LLSLRFWRTKASALDRTARHGDFPILGHSHRARHVRTHRISSAKVHPHDFWSGRVPIAPDCHPGERPVDGAAPAAAGVHAARHLPQAARAAAKPANPGELAADRWSEKHYRWSEKHY
jgi:hypothetical protein